MKKICTKCKRNKSLEDYYEDDSHKDGRQSVCKNCNRAKDKKYRIKHKQEIAERNKRYRAEHKQESLKCTQERIEKHRKAWIPILEEIYGTIACIKCGYDKCFAALEFHHRKPKTKNFSISIILRRKPTPEKIKEIKKCDLLCANCHRELHNGC
jgi:hypothetical protein